MKCSDAIRFEWFDVNPVEFIDAPLWLPAGGMRQVEAIEPDGEYDFKIVGYEDEAIFIRRC